MYGTGPIIDAEHPWPGLLSFPEEAHPFFHGRERESEALLRMIQRETLTVLYGQSGLGKTSLLQAGVFPGLRRAGYLPVSIRLIHEPEAPPLLQQAWQALNDACAEQDVAAPKPRPQDSLWSYLHRVDTVFLNPHGRPVTPVLVFDQFEELFTLGRRDARSRERCAILVHELGDLIENRVPVSLQADLQARPELLDELDLFQANIKVVFSFREDYLADFDGLKEIIRPIMPNRLRLLPLTGDRAGAALLRAANGRLREDAAHRIVWFVAGSGFDRTAHPADLVVEPALLSLVCHELNEYRLGLGLPEIRADLIQGQTAADIIDRFYASGFVDLHPGIRQFVEDRLLTATGHRDSCALDNALLLPGVNESGLQTLVDRRLLRREERGGAGAPGTDPRRTHRPGQNRPRAATTKRPPGRIPPQTAHLGRLEFADHGGSGNCHLARNGTEK